VVVVRLVGWSFAVVGTAVSINRISLSMPGAQLCSLPIIRPHLAGPQGKIGRVSRLQPLTLPF
jgi:hypothetical protein